MRFTHRTGKGTKKDRIILTPAVSVFRFSSAWRQELEEVPEELGFFQPFFRFSSAWKRELEERWKKFRKNVFPKKCKKCYFPPKSAIFFQKAEIFAKKVKKRGSRSWKEVGRNFGRIGALPKAASKIPSGFQYGAALQSIPLLNLPKKSSKFCFRKLLPRRSSEKVFQKFFQIFFQYRLPMWSSEF